MLLRHRQEHPRLFFRLFVMWLNNQKTCLRFPCLGLNTIIESINLRELHLFCYCEQNFNLYISLVSYATIRESIYYDDIYSCYLPSTVENVRLNPFLFIVESDWKLMNNSDKLLMSTIFVPTPQNTYSNPASRIWNEKAMSVIYR